MIFEEQIIKDFDHMTLTELIFGKGVVDKNE